MKLELGNCRIIKADEMNLAVEQYKLVPQSKNPNFRHDGDKYNWIHIGYYANIHEALKKIVHAELAESDSKVAADLIAKINELYSAIKEIEIPAGLDVH